MPKTVIYIPAKCISTFTHSQQRQQEQQQQQQQHTHIQTHISGIKAISNYNYAYNIKIHTNDGLECNIAIAVTVIIEVILNYYNKNLHIKRIYFIYRL